MNRNIAFFLTAVAACVLLIGHTDIKAQTPTTVQVKALMQGLWNGTIHTATPVAVELRTGGASPLASTLVARSTGMMSSTGTVTVVFNNLVTNSYWIIVRHGASLPVSSGQTQTITAGSTFSYDFSDAATKAFGGGSIAVTIGGTTYYMLKSGDFTGDRASNPSDVPVLLTGYPKTNAAVVPPVD